MFQYSDDRLSINLGIKDWIVGKRTFQFFFATLLLYHKKKIKVDLKVYYGSVR